jgi:phosphatidylinositol 4-phosphatase
MSYVQTRGSIPVYWAEVMDLKYKPKLRIFGQIDKSVISFTIIADDRLNLRGNILSNKLKYMEIIYL